MKNLSEKLRLFIISMILPGLVMLSSCKVPIETSGVDVPDPTPLPTFTIYGKVVDALTLEGVAKAKVSLKVNGVWVTTLTADSTADSSNGNGIDTYKGDFSITTSFVENAPLVVTAGDSGVSYVPRYFLINSSSECNAAGNCSYNLGTRSLKQGVTATIYVVESNTGAYVKRTGDAPIPIYADYDDSAAANAMVFTGIDLFKAVQDGTDKNEYTMTIPKNVDSDIYVPAVDSDDDGIVDFESGTTKFTVAQIKNGDLTRAISVNGVFPDVDLSITGSSWRNAGSISGGSTVNFLSKDGVIKIFFNLPIGLMEGESIVYRYTDDLKELSATAQPTEIALTSALSLGNTLLTLTPAVALTENEGYSVSDFTLTSRINENDNSGGYNTNSFTVYKWTDFGTDSIYIPKTGTGSIGSTPSVTVDNFNACTNGDKINSTDTVNNCATGGTKQTAYMLFPELVWGKYALWKYYDATDDATEVSNNAQNITGQSYVAMKYFPKMATNDAKAAFNLEGSNYGGIGFAVAIKDGTTDVQLKDNYGTTATGYGKVQLAIDVYDAEGNKYQIDQLISVQ